jgi:hypothetical protein
MLYLTMDSFALLKQPVEELGLSAQFCAQCRLLGFNDLEAVLVCAPQELVARPHFSYGWLAELSTFLAEKGLLHLLQTTPGKSYG